MAYLLDTHTLIWIIEGSSRLSGKAERILSDKAEVKYVSVVNLWEIAIKVSIEKLSVQEDIHSLPQLLRAKGYELLFVNELHALQVATLPHHHNDPFDRLLIAQAQIEKLQLLSKDPNMPKYNVPVAW